MKLQLQPQSLRLRIDEAELASLLAGESLGFALQQGDVALLGLHVHLGQTLQLNAGQRWQLQLPDAVVRAYVETLPCRDALSLPLADELSLDFEVDVRDSIRERGVTRRQHP